jgi:hypothetical protein
MKAQAARTTHTYRKPADEVLAAFGTDGPLGLSAVVD